METPTGDPGARFDRFLPGSLVAPLVRTIQCPRPRVWVSVLSIGVLAGFLPLLMQVGQLPPAVLATSSVEIVFQRSSSPLLSAKMPHRPFEANYS